MKGWAKAIWIFFLLAAPFIAALIYLIVRGGGMEDRSRAAVSAARSQAEDYVRSVAGTPGPADQIASAKALFDQGAITEDEFNQLKAKALA